jgi:anaerobic ribonucleoside-triphosphate reductase activating protein
MKHCETEIVFREFPDEITLAINISNCPHRCRGCHSPHLQTDCGEPLDEDELVRLVGPKKDLITCVGFMGGDADTEELIELCKFVRSEFPRLKIGQYSGNYELPTGELAELLDYVKIGPYIECLGPVDSPESNQKLYKKYPWGWEEVKSIKRTDWTRRIV